MAPSAAQPVERLAYTLTEARQAIGVGESTMRCLVASGALPAVRVGRRVLISKAAVLAFLDGPGRPDLSARDHS